MGAEPESRVPVAEPGSIVDPRATAHRRSIEASLYSHGGYDGMDDLLERALMLVPEPVVLYDDERILFANLAARRILGATAETELEGARLDDFVTPDLAEISEERRGYVVRNGLEFTDLPVKVRALDGRIMLMNVDIRPLTVGTKTVAMVTLSR
jgi:PAS domain S-box-containing protein